MNRSYLLLTALLIASCKNQPSEEAVMIERCGDTFAKNYREIGLRLEDKKRLWNTNGLSDYKYSVNNYEILVKEGHFKHAYDTLSSQDFASKQQMPKPYSELTTINAIFDYINQALEESGLNCNKIIVEYSQDNGQPLSFARLFGSPQTDGEESFQISRIIGTTESKKEPPSEGGGQSSEVRRT